MTVVVMAYNEEASLETTCREILGALAELPAPTEMLIVDDGSTDDSGAVAERLAGENSTIRVVHHTPNLGLGGVYRTGFREGRGDFLTFFPADGQFPAEIILDFYQRTQQHEMVLGYLSQQNRALLGRILSFGERILYRALFGRMPRFQGIVMFRRELLTRYELKSSGRGWAALMEFILCCSRDDVSMVSVPTAVRPRAHGISKVNNWRTIRSNILQVIALKEVLR